MWLTDDIFLWIILVYAALAVMVMILLALRKRRSDVSGFNPVKVAAPATAANNVYIVNRRYELMAPPYKQGGMATIWLATDRKTGKGCVIKTPRRGTSMDNVYLDKLMLEASYLKQLKHPNIVRYLDDFYYHGEYHLVIEYLNGETLMAASPRSPFSEQQVIIWACQLLDALYYVHVAGIVHRDVNPKNIMLSGSSTVKLIDFGTAKNIHDSGKSGKARTNRDPFTQITNKGFDIPELFMGGDVDQRCDLCGLAQTCVYLLTLKHPNEICLNLFKANWPRSYSEARALVDYLKSLGVSERTAKCLAQGMLFSPDSRFAEAHAFKAALLSADVVLPSPVEVGARK